MRTTRTQPARLAHHTMGQLSGAASQEHAQDARHDHSTPQSDQPSKPPIFYDLLSG